MKEPKRYMHKDRTKIHQAKTDKQAEMHTSIITIKDLKLCPQKT